MSDDIPDVKGRWAMWIIVILDLIGIAIWMTR